MPAAITSSHPKNNIDTTVAETERTMATARENSVGDLIKREGLKFNNTDVSGMRAKLGPFYAKWKGEFGNTAWALLEEGIGRTV